MPTGFAPTDEPVASLRYRLGGLGPDEDFALYENDVCVIYCRTIGDLSRFFNRRVTWSAAALGRDYTFIHAGVVAIKGRALLLPGHSGAGKTTLVAALLELGVDYLSDEYALIDDDGDVHAFARDLSFDVTGGGYVDIAPDALGATTRSVAAPGAIVFATYSEQDASITLDPLSRSSAVAALLQHTVSSRAAPATSLRRVELVARRSSCYRAERGEARAAAAALVRRFEESFDEL